MSAWPSSFAHMHHCKNMKIHRDVILNPRMCNSAMSLPSSPMRDAALAAKHKSQDARNEMSSYSQTQQILNNTINLETNSPE